jgi:DNA-binding NarL/FixJ family response regulator
MAFSTTDTPTLVVIDDDPQHIDTFMDASQNASNEPFKTECVKTLAEGMRRSRRTEIRAIFISLSLLDCQALETFDQFSLDLPSVPILVMAGASNALVVLQLGARGYLLTDHLHRDSLVRVIRKMVERTSTVEALFSEEKRVQIVLGSVGDTALNPQVQCRITSVSIVTGKSLLTQHY